MIKLKDEKGKINYLGYMFKNSFSSWWGLVTGIATIFSFYSINDQKITLDKISISILLFIFLSMLFFFFNFGFRSWDLFKLSNTKIKILDLRKSSTSKNDYVLLIASNEHIQNSALLELKKADNGEETTVGIVEIENRNETGDYQGKIIAINPIHTNELKKYILSQKQLILKKFVSKNLIIKFKEELKV